MESLQTADAHLEFEFSIRAHLKQAWRLFADHWQYFVVSTAILAVLNVMLNGHHGFVIRLLAGIATLIWTYVLMSSTLAAVDGKTGMLSFDAFKLHLPTWQTFWWFAGTIFGSAIIVTGGFILLIIPGIYFMVRLMFSNFAVIDRKQGIVPSLRYSWHLVRHDIFWTSLLCLVVSMLLIFVGVAAIGIGVLVTYPVALLFLSLLYRELSKLPMPTEHAPAAEPMVQQ